MLEEGEQSLSATGPISAESESTSVDHRILQPQALSAYSRQSVISTFMTAVYLCDLAFGIWEAWFLSASGWVCQVVACLLLSHPNAHQLTNQNSNLLHYFLSE